MTLHQNGRPLMICVFDDDSDNLRLSSVTTFPKGLPATLNLPATKALDGFGDFKLEHQDEQPTRALKSGRRNFVKIEKVSQLVDYAFMLGRHWEILIEPERSISADRVSQSVRWKSIRNSIDELESGNFTWSRADQHYKRRGSSTFEIYGLPSL